MKLSVLIHRQAKEEPAEGTLRAYVIQNGWRGCNLLAGRNLSKLDTGKQVVFDRLCRKFPGEHILIEWTVEA